MKTIVNIVIIIGTALSLKALAQKADSLDAAKKLVDQAGDCSGKVISNAGRDRILQRSQFNGIEESPYYKFVSAIVAKGLKEGKAYCDLVKSLDVPPNFAQEAEVRARNANGPVIAPPNSIAIQEASISEMKDVEKKLFIVSGRDLNILTQFDPQNQTAHSDIQDFLNAHDDSGRKCFYELTPSHNWFVSPKPGEPSSGYAGYAVDPNSDLILQMEQWIPGFKIIKGLPDQYGNFVDLTYGKPSPTCEAIDKYFQPVCERMTKRNPVWFTPGRMIFKVIDNNGKPVRKVLNVPGKPTRELELTIYSDSQKGALKCLVMQNFALIQKPSDSRTQSAQLSYNIAPDRN